MIKILSKMKSYIDNMLMVKALDSDYNSEINCHRQASVELELIEGVHVNTNEHPSIIHFSFNKAATQYVKSILVQCATEIGMIHAGMNEYAFDTTFPYLDHLTADEMKQYQHIFKKKGYLYSVFGGMIENIQALEDYKVVLCVRDPRDMLVSNYYSMAFSHPIPDKSSSKYTGFMEKRERARTSSIDHYVLNESIYFNNIFKKYHNLLLKPYENVYVAKYEDMVIDFSSWLDGLLCYCDLQISANLRNTIIANNQKIKPTKEDLIKHLRKGMPGDYKEKLQDETIQHLNATFSTYLQVFGYVNQH